MNYCPACRAFVPEGSQLCPTCSSMLTSGSWKDRFLGWLAKVLVQFAPIRRIEVSNGPEANSQLGPGVAARNESGH